MSSLFSLCSTRSRAVPSRRTKVDQARKRKELLFHNYNWLAGGSEHDEGSRPARSRCSFPPSADIGQQSRECGFNCQAALDQAPSARKLPGANSIVFSNFSFSRIRQKSGIFPSPTFISSA